MGGAMIGFVWEMLNINARAKWIYTVPGVEELKIFEMPVPGFFGFPPFAVECFILWQALILAGVAVPRFGPTVYATTRKRVLAGVAAVLFSVATLGGMELMTWDSVKPKLVDIAGASGIHLERAGYDAFSLAKASPAEIAAAAGAEAHEAATWIESARMATLRGMGTEYLRELQHLGITSIDALAAQDSRKLVSALEASMNQDLVDARVRVWIRGARRALEEG
jgi:hypothetical protein